MLSKRLFQQSRSYENCKKPTLRDSGFFNLFRFGGKTKSGANEWVTVSFPKIVDETYQVVKVLSP